ncbi:MAG: TonB family protein [Aridibacter sp.]
MPQKFYKVFISFLFLSIFSTILFAQTEPTSADVMRERISKAKAYLVVKNYNAAIYELENIKRETKDATLNRGLNVLLIHTYLEQGDYKKAQDFLKEFHNFKQANAAADYFAIAGQVVSCAKKQLERYQALGLSVADRNLPPVASADIESMRNTLELVVEQSRELSKNKQSAANAYALLEETSVIRANLAKDDYDSKRWKDQVSDAREQMVGSRSVIINAVGKVPSEMTAANNAKENTAEIKTENVNDKVKANDNLFELKPVTSSSKSAAVEETETPKKPEKKAEKPKVETKKETIAETKSDEITPKKEEISTQKTVAKKESKSDETTKPQVDSEKTEVPKKSDKVAENRVIVVTSDKKTDTNEPLTVGSLIAYATRKVNPVYPQTARSMRMTGVVKVEVMIDEDGEVAAVENTDGPAMLRRAAEDAVKKWRFKPFVRDGQPVRATGFVSFNFSL